jgi:hypothetical protein
MRTIYWILASVVIVAAYVVFNGSVSVSGYVVPGQYPATERPAFWPAVQAVGLYRPRSMMGDDSLSGKGETDAKLACVMNASNWVIQ